ncbi:MAG: GAF domain-containing protein [Gammaproteobacteria bacterium]|nr:GAF domain-containing protein [Gammaproteobacteria bacterium]
MLNPNFQTYNSTLTRRLVVYVLLFSSFITLLATTNQLYMDYSSDIDLIEEHLQQIEDVHLKSLTSTLWVSDTKELRTHLEGISQLRDMQFAQVKDEERVWTTVGTPQSKNVISRQYPMIHHHRGQNIKIGTLTVVASVSNIYQRLIDKVWIILVSNAIKTFLVALFILYICHTLIIRHLTRIADFVRGLHANTLDNTLRLKRESNPPQKMDELDLVTNAINQMRGSLKTSINALKQSEARSNDAQRMAHIGSWELDLVTNKLLWSDEIYRIFGTDPRKLEASYETFLEAIHPDDRERVDSAYAASVKNKKAYRIEHRLRMPDGAIKYVIECCETFYSDTGQPLRSVGFVQDITQRYQTEQSLKRLNRSLQALRACSEILIRAEDEQELLDKVCRVIVEDAGYHLAWVGFAENDNAKSVRPVAQAGYEQGYLNTLKLAWGDTEQGCGPTGTAIRTAQPSIIRNIPDDPRYALWREPALQRGYRSSIALPLIRKKQPFGALNVYARDADAFDEEEVQLLSELADDLAYGIITLRSHAERDQLQRQLQQAQKMDAIGQLSGGIAHDFNNQLGVVIGYLDLLENYADNDKKSRQWIESATKATLRCIDLTRQLLTFSRRQATQKTVVNLNTTLRSLKGIIARSVTPEVDVRYFPGDNLWLTEINDGELQDSILNLVINARDAMPGGGTLLIETSNRDLDAAYATRHPGIEAGEYVQLLLSDTGTGMNKETLEHIFEPFFTTKPEGQGTGLGMAMVYGFVKRYDGHINVYSELGVGTSIRLYLPRAMATKSSATVDDNQPLKLPGGRESILIVDDEIDLLQLADQYLSDLGYYTHLAENAQQALVALDEKSGEKIDLLFSDVVMPGGMSGYELAQQATQQRPELKVLLTSGFTSKTIAHNGLARFSTHLLSKPYRKADLAQRIRLVLDEKPQTEQG